MWKSCIVSLKDYVVVLAGILPLMGNLAGHQTGSCSTQRLMLLGHSFILGPKSVSWDLHSLTHILVHLGCKGKVTLGHFGSRWVTHIHQTSVSHNSGGLKSKMKVSAWSSLVRPSFLIYNWCLLNVSSHGSMGCGLFFINAPVPFLQAPPSPPKHLPKVQPSQRASRVQHRNFGGTQTFRPKQSIFCSLE